MTAQIIPFLKPHTRHTPIVPPRDYDAAEPPPPVMLCGDEWPESERPIGTCTRLERRCLQAAARASDPDAQRIWQNHADHVALNLRRPSVYLPPMPAEWFEGFTPPTFDPRTRPARLLNSITLALLALAALISVIPAGWLP